MFKICFSAPAMVLFLGSIPVSGALVEDFTGFSTNVASFQVGGDRQQVISTSVGISEGGVAAIDGTSIFMTIDTTNTPSATLDSIGGGLRTTISPFSPGDLASSNPADYDVVFDIAANGFAPANVDLFLNFRDPTNTNVFSQISINQNNSALSPFIAQLGVTDGPVSVSIGLENFSGLPADISALANADRFQFQLNSRSPLSSYSSNNILVLDNVGISVTAVPEPSSLALLAIGGVGLAARRRQKSMA